MAKRLLSAPPTSPSSTSIDCTSILPVGPAQDKRPGSLPRYHRTRTHQEGHPIRHAAQLPRHGGKRITAQAIVDQATATRLAR
jgi:hypothetical protein